MAAEQTSCPICCENYNKSVHQEIKCEFNDCDFSCCKTCLRQFIISTRNEPNCMSCKKIFSQGFLVKNLNQSWIKNTYRNHRKQLLLDITIAQLAEAQPEVVRYNNIEEQKLIINQVRENLRKQQEELYKQQNILYKLQRRDKESSVRSKFIMGCPNTDCRGFLNSSYKCELCNQFTCSQCLCIKGPSLNSTHECNSSDLASAQYIKSNSKSCPSCGERISKISGCDQMWCTSCKTAFSWNTGKIDNGVVHNPHFFQYQSQNNEIIQNNGLGDCNANNLPAWSIIRRISLKEGIHNNCLVELFPDLKEGKRYPTIDKLIHEIYRFIRHIRHYEIPRINENIDKFSDTMPIRIDYLNQKICKEKMANRLIQNDKKRIIQSEILRIFDLINQVGLEMMWGICNNNEENSNNEFLNVIKKEIIKFIGLLIYCNEHLIKASFNYGVSMPIILVKGTRHAVRESIPFSIYIDKHSTSKSNIEEILNHHEEKYINIGLP